MFYSSIVKKSNEMFEAYADQMLADARLLLGDLFAFAKSKDISIIVEWNLYERCVDLVVLAEDLGGKPSLVVEVCDEVFLVKKFLEDGRFSSKKCEKITVDWIMRCVSDQCHLNIIYKYEKAKKLERAVELQVEAKPIGYYVYSHRFPSGKIYFGKGRGTRFLDLYKSGRSWLYEDTLAKEGVPVVTIVRERMAEDDAYQLEHQLIVSERHLNAKNVLNITDGLEKANVRVMPWRTLSCMVDGGKRDAILNTCVSMESNDRKSFYFGLEVKAVAIISKHSIESLLLCIKNDGARLPGGGRLVRKDEAFGYMKFLGTVIFLAKIDGSDSCACTLGFYFSWVRGLHADSLSLFKACSSGMGEVFDYIDAKDHNGSIFDGFHVCSLSRFVSINNGVVPKVFSKPEHSFEFGYRNEDLFGVSF